MSEKIRKKKDHEDKNKKMQRTHAATRDIDEAEAPNIGPPKVKGRVRKEHKIDSVRTGFGDFRHKA